MLFAPSGKGRFRPISRKGGQTPLKPPLNTPPFAAAQFGGGESPGHLPWVSLGQPAWTNRVLHQVSPELFVCCVRNWEKESIHHPAPVQNFSLQKRMGSTEERFRWWIWFSLFYRVFVSTTSLESFSLGPEKFSENFSFGGVCVRFFLLHRGQSYYIKYSTFQKEWFWYN